jgi:hypothetical protein
MICMVMYSYLILAYLCFYLMNEAGLLSFFSHFALAFLRMNRSDWVLNFANYHAAIAINVFCKQERMRHTTHIHWIKAFINAEHLWITYKSVENNVKMAVSKSIWKRNIIQQWTAKSPTMCSRIFSNISEHTTAVNVHGYITHHRQSV